MDLKTVKQLIPLYLEDELPPEEMQEIKGILAQNQELRVYSEEVKKSWDMLDELEAIEPQPGYVSAFWTRLSARKSWGQDLVSRLQTIFLKPRLVPVLATFCVVLILGLTVLRLYVPSNYSGEVAALSQDDLELIEYMELTEDYEVIENMEFWQDMEIIENYEGLKKNSQS